MGNQVFKTDVNGWILFSLVSILENVKWKCTSVLHRLTILTWKYSNDCCICSLSKSELQTLITVKRMSVLTGLQYFLNKHFFLKRKKFGCWQLGSYHRNSADHLLHIFGIYSGSTSFSCKNNTNAVYIWTCFWNLKLWNVLSRVYLNS